MFASRLRMRGHCQSADKSAQRENCGPRRLRQWQQQKRLVVVKEPLGGRKSCVGAVVGTCDVLSTPNARPRYPRQHKQQLLPSASTTPCSLRTQQWSPHDGYACKLLCQQWKQ